MSILVGQLRQIARNIAIRAKRRRGWFWWRRRPSHLNAYAIVISLAADRLTELETQMRTADAAVKALVEDDKALRQQVSDLKAQGAAKDAEIEALKANAIGSDTLADVNALVPEVVPPATDGQQQQA